MNPTLDPEQFKKKTAIEPVAEVSRYAGGHVAAFRAHSRRIALPARFLTRTPRMCRLFGRAGGVDRSDGRGSAACADEGAADPGTLRVTVLDRDGRRHRRRRRDRGEPPPATPRPCRRQRARRGAVREPGARQIRAARRIGPGFDSSTSPTSTCGADGRKSAKCASRSRRSSKQVDVTRDKTDEGAERRVLDGADAGADRRAARR